MIDPDIDFNALAIEYEVVALFDAIPDGCKTQRFWDQFKSLCPDVLLTKLLPVKPI
jgi:hypothetical protein